MIRSGGQAQLLANEPSPEATGDVETSKETTQKSAENGLRAIE
ncbi:hypothetical protein USDA257_c03830 [Sinorhizobium fredii USDA 257]|uniref:Uncharacterized protein n=1 Tax=Sinorhizobium fredii (strain USDA 257) TaxID=1185652 RepID=I3WZC4_SINF2|nr:hypothetical protein USDA257_c03830 [Sinorhizobium fredii USDA 257]